MNTQNCHVSDTKFRHVLRVYAMPIQVHCIVCAWDTNCHLFEPILVGVPCLSNTKL